MKKKMPTVYRIVIFIIQIMFLTGCGPRLVKLDPVLSQNAGSSHLPITVGYYFSPETTKYEYVETEAELKRIGIVTGRDQIYPIGRVSIELFAEAYRRLFENTEPVQQIPFVSPAKTSSLSAIIQVDFEELHRPLAHAAEVKYRCKLYSSDGKRLIASWPFYGRANTGKRAFQTPGRTQSLAMKDAAERFITFFRYYPGIESWLTQISVVDNTYASIPSKERATTKDQQITNMPVVNQTNDYVVAADPFFDLSRRIEILGSKQMADEILPVRIVVLNKGNKAIWVQRDGVTSFNKGNLMAKAPETPKSSFAHMASAPGAVGQGAGVLTVIEALFTAPGYSRKYDEWQKRTESIFQSLLTDTLLHPGESTQGIIYLPLPRGESAGNYIIELKLVAAADGSAIPVRITLTDKEKIEEWKKALDSPLQEEESSSKQIKR
jgi:hypothetical protein